MALTITERYAASSDSQLGTSIIVPLANTAAGSLLVLATAAGLTSKTGLSISDTKSNVWALDVTSAGASRALSFLSCPNSIALTTLDAITVTWNTATSGNVAVWLEEVTGAATSGPYDQTATAGNTAGTAYSVGPTGTLRQSDEVAFSIALWNVSATTLGTIGGGFAATAAGQLSPTGFGAELLQQTTSATTALTATGTLSVSRTWRGLAATYSGPRTATGSTLSLMGVG